MKGILFKPDMIRAIREGRKTQTRRLVNPQPPVGLGMGDYREGEIFIEAVFCDLDGDVVDAKCPQPRYLPGETVYVKEGWATDAEFEGFSAGVIEGIKVATIPIWYKVADSQIERPHQVCGRWRSPLFMPEWAARIHLRILSAAPQRLQEITEEDAAKEAANPYLVTCFKGGQDYRAFCDYHRESWPVIDHADEGDIVRFVAPNMGFAAFQTRNPKASSGVLNIPAKEAFAYVGTCEQNYRNGYAILWDSINKKQPWSSNSWVWRYVFEVVKK